MSGMELLASDSDDSMMLLSASDLSICVNLGAFGTWLSSRTVMPVPWFCELVINQQFSFASMCVPLDLTWISWCLVNLMSFAPVPFLWTDWLSMDKLMFGESDVIALRHSCYYEWAVKRIKCGPIHTVWEMWYSRLSWMCFFALALVNWKGNHNDQI